MSNFTLKIIEHDDEKEVELIKTPISKENADYIIKNTDDITCLKPLWSLEHFYLQEFKKAIRAAKSDDRKTLKDFVNLGFNSVIYKHDRYYLTYEGNIESDVTDKVSEDMLNKEVVFAFMNEDEDGHYAIYVEDAK